MTYYLVFLISNMERVYVIFFHFLIYLGWAGSLDKGTGSCLVQIVLIETPYYCHHLS